MEAPRGLRKANTTAILGAGFDPGMVNAFARFRRSWTSPWTGRKIIDIVDINAAINANISRTNFDPEINFGVHRHGLTAGKEGAC